jgi:hypothetical protein
VAYVITLTRCGEAGLSDPTPAALEDPLPDGLAGFGAASDSGGVVAVSPGGVVTWTGAITVPEPVHVLVSASVQPAAVGRVLSNQARVLFEPQPGVLGGVRSDDPHVPGPADPTAFLVKGAPLDVPAISSGGLALLVLSIAAAALARLRR